MKSDKKDKRKAKRLRTYEKNAWKKIIRIFVQVFSIFELPTQRGIGFVDLDGSFGLTWWANRQLGLP